MEVVQGEPEQLICDVTCDACEKVVPMAALSEGDCFDMDQLPEPWVVIMTTSKEWHVCSPACMHMLACRLERKEEAYNE